MLPKEHADASLDIETLSLLSTSWLPDNSDHAGFVMPLVGPDGALALGTSSAHSSTLDLGIDDPSLGVIFVSSSAIGTTADVEGPAGGGDILDGASPDFGMPLLTADVVQAATDAAMVAAMDNSSTTNNNDGAAANSSQLLALSDGPAIGTVIGSAFFVAKAPSSSSPSSATVLPPPSNTPSHKPPVAAAGIDVAMLQHQLETVFEDYGYFPTYPCQVCGSTFDDADAIKAHIQKTHMHGEDDFDKPPPRPASVVLLPAPRPRKPLLVKDNDGMDEEEEEAAENVTAFDTSILHTDNNAEDGAAAAEGVTNARMPLAPLVGRREGLGQAPQCC